MDQREMMQRILDINEQTAMEIHIGQVSEQAWWITQMMNAGLISIDNGPYVTLRLTPKGRECVTACEALMPLWAKDTEGQQHPPSDLMEDKPARISIGAQVLLYLDDADPREAWDINVAVPGNLGPVLDLLVERGLITFDRDDETYEITPSGHNWLQGK